MTRRRRSTTSARSRPILVAPGPRRHTAMVQRLIRERFDDLDGSPAVETVRFGYAGREYEIDLNEEHASHLDEALAPYVEHARPANGSRRGGGGGLRVNGRDARRNCGPSGS